jgi:methyl-accepting chemotaxis protein|tara:strand:+ start:1067 stop:3085 length:2019 start_codon:yes stop_codon:yes gene_type:complete
MTTKKLNIDILARDKSKQALSQVQTRLGNLRKSVFSLRSAFVGLGAGLAIRSFVNVGKEVESLNIRFKFLFGSVEEGSKAFDNLAKFAGTVPFSLEEISRASGNLAVVAKDADDLNRVLEITGNVAAVTGLDFETTSSQIQRAFAGGIGAADLFRERGVRALLGFEAGAKVSAEETVKRFEELFSGNGRFAGATKDLATTLEGTISMLGDKFFNFQKDVAQGFFDELKGEFGDLNQFLEANEDQIRDIATAIGENFAGAITKTSNTIKGVAPAVKTIADAFGTTITGFTSLPTFVQSSGIIAALLFGKKGFLAFSAVSFLMGQIEDIIDKSSAGLTRPLVDMEEVNKAKADIAEFTKEMEFLAPSLKQAGIDLNNILDFTVSPNSELLKMFPEIGTQVERYKTLLSKVLRLQESLFVFDQEQNMVFIDSMSKSLSGFNSVMSKSIDKTNEFAKEGTEKVEAFREVVGLLDNDFIDLFPTLAHKKRFNNLGKQVDDLKEKFPQFTKTLEDAGNTTKQLDQLFTNTFNGFADTLANSIMTGKFAFKDFARSVIADIARMIAKQQALIAIQKVAGLFGGNIFGFNIGGLLPTRSSGGRVNAGMPVSVGEAGREIFIPQSSGTIVPNNQTGGSTNINFTINTVDATGVDELLTNRRSTIINVINDALNRQGKEALV